MIVLATWVFTVLSRFYPGGQGDRRTIPGLHGVGRHSLRSRHVVPGARLG